MGRQVRQIVEKSYDSGCTWVIHEDKRQTLISGEMLELNSSITLWGSDAYLLQPGSVVELQVRMRIEVIS